MVVWMILAACAPPVATTAAVDDCDGPGARSTCLEPTMPEAYYIAQSSAYFDTMDYNADLDVEMPYAEHVVRWEWPPWLLLTAFGQDNIESTDTFLRLYPSVVPERECYAFDQQPFGRCRVVFYYDDHGGLPCPIYEEFTFNDAGEITFIEAWSDVPGLRPMDPATDPWGEVEMYRLSTEVPGLGTPSGQLSLDSDEMAEAAEENADVAELVYRASDWYTTWLEAYSDAGEDFWEIGCGWDLSE